MKASASTPRESRGSTSPVWSVWSQRGDHGPTTVPGRETAVKQMKWTVKRGLGRGRAAHGAQNAASNINRGIAPSRFISSCPQPRFYFWVNSALGVQLPG